MKLIVGLGNPGVKYEKTRHNVGFVAVDAFAFKHDGQFSFDKKFNAEIAMIKKSNLADENIVLAKPHTFMNNSGEAVEKIAEYYEIDPSDIWLIYDDIDLPLGTLKIKTSGSAGSHNGVKSVVSRIGQDVPRFRIGVESRGDSASTFQDTSSFVLSNFFGPEKDIIVDVLDKCVNALEMALRRGFEQTMNKFN